MATPSTAALLGVANPVFGFVLPPYDYYAKTYIASGASDSDDLATVTFKRGGASGTTVATLTYTYVGSTNNELTATLTVP